MPLIICRHAVRILLNACAYNFQFSMQASADNSQIHSCTLGRDIRLSAYGVKGNSVLIVHEGMYSDVDPSCMRLQSPLLLVHARATNLHTL